MSLKILCAMKIVVNLLVLFGLPFLFRESGKPEEPLGHPTALTFQKTAHPTDQFPANQVTTDTTAAHHP